MSVLSFISRDVFIFDSTGGGELESLRLGLRILSNATERCLTCFSTFFARFRQTGTNSGTGFPSVATNKRVKRRSADLGCFRVQCLIFAVLSRWHAWSHWFLQ